MEEGSRSGVKIKKTCIATTRRVVRRGQITRSSNDRNNKDEIHIPLPPFVASLARGLLLDVPLLGLILLVLSSFSLFYFHQTVLFPQMQKYKWTEDRAESELTYYDMSCNASSILTATNRTPLLLHAHQSIQERTDKVRLHGAGLISNIFPAEDDKRRLLQLFRSFALRKNERVGNRAEDGGVDVVGVIENDHRWSFAFQAGEDPSIAPLLESIGRNQVLKETLEGLLGENPAIVELSTITAEQGALSQGWHSDTDQENGDSLKFSSTFSDLYSLLIPVQNTTKEMGPTAICPGTHYCTHHVGCEEHGFSPLDEDGIWKAGDGLLFNSHLAHQGTAHTKGPTRVAIVISFAANPSRKLQPPLAAGYVIPWNSMGFTWNDMANASITMVQPWATLRSLAWNHNPNTKGWDFFRFCVAHMGNHRHPPQVVVMPYVKLLPISLVGQANYHNYYSPWQVFLLDTLQRLCFASLVVYLLGLGGYSQVRIWVISVNTENHSTTSKSTKSIPWDRLLLLHTIAFAIFIGVVYSHPKDLSHSVPLAGVAEETQIHFDEEYLQSLACPQVDDVLMGPHFLSDASKWSPGNRKWHADAKELLPWYLNYSIGLPCVFSDAVLDTLLGSSGKSSSRILLQNEHSDWIELNYQEAKERSEVWLRRMMIVKRGGPCGTSTRSSRQPICRLGFDHADQYAKKTECRCNRYNPTRNCWKIELSRRTRPLAKGVKSIAQEFSTMPKVNSLLDHNLPFELGEYVEARMNSKTRKWLRATVTEKRGRSWYMLRFEVATPEHQFENPLPAILMRTIKPSPESSTFAKSQRTGFAWQTVSSRVM